MPKSPCTISFVIPALNEEIVIESVVRQIWGTIDDLVDLYEIILVDDGSADGTGAIMDRLEAELRNVRVLHHERNRGLGRSYQHGLQEARFEYVMMLCGDGGLPATSLPPIIAQIGRADIVVPYMLNLKTIKTPTRYVVSRTYTRLLNLISGHRLQYYNGLPVHRREFLNRIQITSSGFGFQGEILCKLLKSGCSYVQVPVQGAEFTKNSSAFRLKNVISVTHTLVRLVFVLWRFSGLNLHPSQPVAPAEPASGGSGAYATDVERV